MQKIYSSIAVLKDAQSNNNRYHPPLFNYLNKRITSVGNKRKVYRKK